MPLIACPDCDKRISDRAEQCINCGCPISQIRDQLILEEKDKKKKDELNQIQVIDLKKKNMLERPKPFVVVLAIQVILALISILLLVAADRTLGGDPRAVWGLILLNGFVLIFIARLYHWKKSGFWGLLIFSALGFGANAVFKDVGIASSLLVFLWPAVLYFVMQQKTHGESVWNLLD